jgi:hypothetical protein
MVTEHTESLEQPLAACHISHPHGPATMQGGKQVGWQSKGRLPECVCASLSV